jgi:hypothetical protein|tara:strand:- start:1019 stop:1393 length:375 start_codon:yes stop_codon:yes gene_type:complete
MKISDNTSISMPMRNLLAILAAVAVGTMAYFGVIERLNKIETNFQLMQQDLIAASEFIDGVPKGDMVSPQIQELYMLVEYLAESTEKLKEQMESEIPLILKNEMVIQFHEERLIDLEERKNGTH